MKEFVKKIFNGFFRAITAPHYLLVLLLDRPASNELVFQYFADALSVMPGLPGEFMRRAYYRWTLDAVGGNLVLGFGSIFTHRRVSLGDGVRIGQYTLIGRARIGAGAMISDHVDILSGRYHHAHASDGSLVEQSEQARMISIGNNVWIGAGSAVMADIGEGAIVGAGSTVVRKVEPFTVVAGNPASLIKKRENHHERA